MPSNLPPLESHDPATAAASGAPLPSNPHGIPKERRRVATPRNAVDPAWTEDRGRLLSSPWLALTIRAGQLLTLTLFAWLGPADPSTLWVVAALGLVIAAWIRWRRTSREPAGRSRILSSAHAPSNGTAQDVRTGPVRVGPALGDALLAGSEIACFTAALAGLHALTSPAVALYAGFVLLGQLESTRGRSIELLAGGAVALHATALIASMWLGQAAGASAADAAAALGLSSWSILVAALLGRELRAPSSWPPSVPPRTDSSQGAERYAVDLRREVDQRTRELAKANQKLRELHDQLVKAQRLSAAEELAGAVAHSINNPLAALIGTAELAMEEDPTPELVRIRQLARRIQHVVESTLELYRRGSMTLVRESPAILIEALADAVGDRCSKQNVTVHTEVEHDLPTVMVDRTLFVAALVNIAENALDAMSVGGELWLQCISIEALHAVRIRIADTGSGVPVRIRKRVFEPFFTTKGGGTGLGLAIAQGIVHGHQGSLQLGARPLGGTIVTIDLPAGSAIS